jgi:hypothetical protein
MVVVDSKFLSGTKSTIRFIDPVTNVILDEMRDNGSTARYVDCVVTSNGRLWITDDGDKGVVVVRLGELGGGPPFAVGDVLLYTGLGEFADFIYDSAVSPTFLLSPQRLATNGTTRVVVADGGSDNVTILDATYPADTESIAIVANVDLGLAAGKVCIDVEVAAGKAYVTTTDAAAPIKVIDLTTLVVTTISAGIVTTVGGIGKVADGSKIYVGAGSGSPVIYEISTTTDTVTATIASFSGGAFPFAFQLNGVALPPGAGGGFTPGAGGGVNGGGGCGLVGLDALLALGLLSLLSRRRR